MIKKIHYCWFGKKKKPHYVISCIRSWKKFFPGWEIIEWNESNFDIEHSCDYVKEAYKHKAWAFVSDYVRFKVMYDYGGLYFDTDVKVIKPFIDKVNVPFFALEKTGFINPGLLFYVFPNDSCCNDMLKIYEMESYKHGDGNQTTICQRITSYFINYGFKPLDSFQTIQNYSFYPSEYFCPIDYRTKKKYITNKTFTIHLYKSSWINRWIKIKNNIGRFKKKII